MVTWKSVDGVVGVTGGPMRDPDSHALARQQLDVLEAPSLDSASSWGFDSQKTTPRFARGSQQIDRVALGDAASEAADLGLATLPHSFLVFGVNGRVTDVNALAETLVGYSRRELVGERLDVIGSKLADVELLGRVHFVPASAGAYVRHRNGRSIPVEVMLCPHGEQSTVAVLRPLETTVAGLREEEVAQIVHDLKSPLSTIALEAQLLDDKLVRGNPSDMRGTLARITHNVEFLDRMVHDLLDLCSLNVGRLELHRKPTELRTLLEQIIDRVVATRDRGRVFLQAAKPLTTLVDEMRIERVVANLLQNALKYAPQTSNIFVRLAVVDQAVRISVSDAGPGIPPTEIGFVFDKFRRASTAGDKEGSGLGLYVSKKIIEAHGGRIDVTSVRGAGTQFFFELPAT
jgi:PAS domain S-box-containing protein